MSAVRLGLLGALVTAVAAAACVEIATGPGGIASIRLDPAPPSIIIGDVLRDSTGAETRLHAVAFDAKGDSIPGSPFRFIYVPLSTDTTHRDDSALVVDSLTGAVRAPGPRFIVPRGRVGVRVGTQLQALDTIDIVPRPRRLTRASQDGDSLRNLVFDCRDALGAPLFKGVLSDEQARNAGVSGEIGNYSVLPTLLRGDSATNDSVPVRRYLVRYDIVSPAGIPTVQLDRGGTRPVIGIISGTSDTPLRYDTTDASGLTSARLRIYPRALTGGALARDTIPVTVRATAIRARGDTVPSPVEFVVRLLRLRRTTDTGTPFTCP